MKKLLLLLVFGAMMFSASAQYIQRVLVEEFTNASCPPCAAQNPAFNALLQANASKVTAIKYQTSWPGTDPMNAQNPAEVTTRVNYYGVSGVPNGFVNGDIIANDCNGYDGAPACLSGAEIDAAYAGTTPVNITLNFSFNATFDTMYLSANVLSDVALTGDLRLHVGVIEEVINFSAAPGTNGEKEFFQPMRKMFPNAEGSSTGDFAAGETKSYNFVWKVPAHIYNENQLGLVAFLQNHTTKEVFQSAYAAPATPKIGIPSGISIVCESGNSPTVTFTNEAEEALTAATFKYRTGNNPWTDYEWVGNLAPGASAQITLTDIVITQSGNNLVDILAVSSNNGAIQTNIIAGYSTLTIKGLFDAPVALPVASPFQSAAFPPTGWLLKNEGTNGWKLATNAGAGSTRSAKNNMYDYANGLTELQSPKIDLTQSSGTTTLTFDHAYTYYVSGADVFFDSLRLEITGDCGATWTTLMHDGYEGLATAPSTSASFTPTAAQWRANTFDISSYNGQEIMLRFTAETGFGNNAYIDNVNITTAVGVKNLDLTTFSLSPNPTRDIAQLRFGLDKAQNIQLNVFNALGVLVQSQDLGQLSSGDHAVSLDAVKLSSGSYRVVLQGSEGVAQTQWIVVK